MRESGTYQSLGDLNYFIPASLPPKNPEFSLTPKLLSLYGEASFALGQLNEMSRKLPDPERFIRAYVIKEALLSSAIEGVHTTLSDVFSTQYSENKANKNTQLVLNYTQALASARTLLFDQNFPLSIRVILNAHKVLLSAGEGESKSPGEFRRQTVRVGNLTPPPAPEIPKLMAELDRYMNDDQNLPPLIQAGLAHVHFETIHPFLDANGRIGRLLIVLMLMDKKLLTLPVLYPSYYFKGHHLEYYQKLDRVRTHGDYEGWIEYYLAGIRDSAEDAHHRAKDIEALEQHLNRLILDSPDFNRVTDTATDILAYLFKQPICGIAEISKTLGKAYNTINKIIQLMLKADLVSELPISQREKVYRFDKYLQLLEKEYHN